MVQADVRETVSAANLRITRVGSFSADGTTAAFKRNSWLSRSTLRYASECPVASEPGSIQAAGGVRFAGL